MGMAWALPPLHLSHLFCQESFRPCIGRLSSRSNSSIKYSIDAGGDVAIAQIELSFAKELAESSEWERRFGNKRRRRSRNPRRGCGLQLAGIHFEDGEERARNLDGRKGHERMRRRKGRNFNASLSDECCRGSNPKCRLENRRGGKVEGLEQARGSPRGEFGRLQH